MHDTIVLGLGNPLMADEGVGCYVIDALRKTKPPPLADIREIGTGGMDILHLMRGRRKMIVVDCARMGIQAGEIRRFTPDDVVSVKDMSEFSLHDLDIMGVLDLARLVGEEVPQVVIFGIQPEKVGFGEGLSDVLRKRLGEYVEAVRSEIAGNTSCLNMSMEQDGAG